MTDSTISALTPAVLPLTGAENFPMDQGLQSVFAPLAAIGVGSKVLVTSGGSLSVAAGTANVILDGAATTFALTFPAPVYDGQVLAVSAGSAVSAAFSAVVTAPATTIKTVPSTLAAGVGVAWKYNASNTTWYRLY